MHLTVIAKSPVPGRVKTRLCPPLSFEQAADVAAAALADTFDAVRRALAAVPLAGPVRRVLLLDGAPGAWVPSCFDVVAQRGDSLGERLANGFAELGPGVVVGMDTPLACESLGRAVASVQAGVDVIGLAVDGGYWAIGLAQVDSRVFEDVAMSASHTGLTQLRRLRQLGRPVRLLHLAQDLDTAGDLIALGRGTGVGRLDRLAGSLLGS